MAKLVQDQLNLVQISTGDLLRAEVKNQTELGTKAKGYMEAGELVPDEIVIAMLKSRIDQPDCQAGFILDGFPRTIPQAEALEAQGVRIDKVINYVATKETIIIRLSGRRTCKQCGAIYHLTNKPPRVESTCDVCDGPLYQRDDDKPEAIENRLAVYEKQTAPLIGYYKKQGLLQDVGADDSSEVILPKVVACLSEA
jgi:adenylate kinase